MDDIDSLLFTWDGARAGEKNNDAGQKRTGSATLLLNVGTFAQSTSTNTIWPDPRLQEPLPALGGWPAPEPAAAGHQCGGQQDPG